MSTSSLNLSTSGKKEVSSYAVYIFNINKHVSLERKSSSDSNKVTEPKQLDIDESSVCLSLLETNLEAEQETIVRCHLLKTFSATENAGFENEGKLVVLSDESKPFGCYYHHLVKNIPFVEKSTDNEESQKKLDKKISFFVCLIGPASGEMESFCYEFSIFCCSLLPILDLEGQENRKEVQQKLQHWYSCCIEYTERCVEKFKQNLVLIFQSALCGKIIVECEDEKLCWDLTRFADACSLNTLLQITSSIKNIESNLSQKDSAADGVIHLTVEDGVISTSHDLVESSYCQMWVEKLLSCNPSEHHLIRNILENFRLKTIQDLNTLKRLLKKAENDYYSLFKAYQFLKASGYENILLYHVKQEALLSVNEEALDIIRCLKDFIENDDLSKLSQVNL